MLGGFSRRASLLAAVSIVSSLAIGITSVAAQTCAPCGNPTTCTPHTAVKLRMRKLNNGPGAQRLLFRGDLTVPDGAPLNLAASGLRLVVSDGLGATTLDVQVPPGGYDSGSGSGWLANGRGTSWSYRDKSGTAAGGLRRVQVKRHGITSGDMKVVLFGQDMQFVLPERPITITTALAASDATALYCSEVVLTEDSCRFRNQENKLLCYDRVQ